MMRALLLALCIGLAGQAAIDGAPASQAAAQTTPPPAPATPAAPAPRPTPPELQASRDAAKLVDPAARVKAYDDILATYPASPYLVDFHVQKIAALAALTTGDLRAIDAEIAATRTAKTPRTPHEVLNLLAMTLMSADATLGRAEAIEREAIGMLDEETYARDWQKRYTKHPDDPKELAAQYKEGKSRFAGDLSRYELTLGRILIKEGRDADAKAAFESSLAVMPLQGSASLALATLAEKAGDAAEAYRRLAWAAITGRLPAADRPRLERAYTSAHPGATGEALEADLDRLFRDSFKNPIAAPRYTPSPARTTRTVLAEMFTGAGCVPCLSVDLSFETMLERYSRDDLVVLMYHIHAPTPDPLSNPSAQARGKYYGVNGAPTTFIDGVQEVAEGPRDDAPDIFTQLDGRVERHLEAPAAGAIRLSATRHDAIVTARATVNGVTAGSPDVRVQIALVEREVRYSGENGQRFHPMVVRALGGADQGGFVVDPAGPEASVSQTFDLDALAAANLKYYDDYAADMKARVGLTTTFLEHKHQIDPHNIAIVAFLQDMKTRRVLQAAMTSPVEESSEPVRWSAAPLDPAVGAHAGDRLEIGLTARLGEGWHLYSLMPTASGTGPQPTLIALAPGQPFTLGGEIGEPPAISRYDANFDADTSFFEEEATFTVPVRVSAAAKPGRQNVAITATYQMCNTRLCLPPTQVTVSAPVTIK